MNQKTSKPGPQEGPQEDFCAARTDVALGGGSFYGGKSYSLVLEAGRNVDHQYYRGVIFRRTFVQITDAGGLCDIADQLYPQLGGRPTDNRVKWTFPSGAIIKFNHLQHDSDKHNYRSSQFSFLGIDQLEEFSMEAFFFLRARNRPSPGYNRRAYCRATCNPEPGWLAKFIQYYWDPRTGYHIKERSGHIRYFTRIKGEVAWVDKDWIGPNNIHPISFTYIPSSMFDNKLGMKKDPEYASNVSTMDNVSVERYLKGNWKVSSDGNMFYEEWFKYIEKKDLPKGMRLVRYWDFAASEVKPGKDPDWTAGVLMGEYLGDIYIIDVDAFREDPGYTIKRVQEKAKEDGSDVMVRWEEEKGSAGKFNTSHLSGKLLGYDAKGDPVKGDKVERAKPLSSAAYNGHVYIVIAPWNDDYISDATAFPNKKRDKIDGSTGGYKVLCSEKKVWPQYSISKVTKLKIDWKDRSGSGLNYGAFYQSDDGELYFVAAIYDQPSGELYIYSAVKYKSILPDEVAMRTIREMKLLRFHCEKIVGNEACVSSLIKGTARQINTSLQSMRCSKRITKPVIYDHPGAITYANAMFNNDMITIGDRAYEAAAQCASWAYKDNGDPEDGYNFCRTVCMIVSEIREGMKSEAEETEFMNDYAPKKKQRKAPKSGWQTA